MKRSKSTASNKSLDLEDHIRPQYYMKSLQYHYSVKSVVKDTTQKFKEHFVQSLASMKYVKKLRIPSMDNVIKSRMQLAKLDSKLESSRLS